MNDLVEMARHALMTVHDPEAGLNIVDLGLVYDVREAPGGAIDVVMTFTTEACPAGPLLMQAAETALRAVPGIEAVRIEITFDPPWTPEMITADGQAMLRA